MKESRLEALRNRLPGVIATCVTLTLLASAILLASEASQEPGNRPSITITVVPPRGGGPDRMERIGGLTKGADTVKHRVVVYSRTDQWYVQPFVAAPFTSLRSNGSFETSIHLGAEYAALLVEATFKPPSTMSGLPGIGGGVVAVARVNAK